MGTEIETTTPYFAIRAVLSQIITLYDPEMSQYAAAKGLSPNGNKNSRQNSGVFARSSTPSIANPRYMAPPKARALNRPRGIRDEDDNSNSSKPQKISPKISPQPTSSQEVLQPINRKYSFQSSISTLKKVHNETNEVKDTSTANNVQLKLFLEVLEEPIKYEPLLKEVLLGNMVNDNDQTKEIQGQSRKEAVKDLVTRILEKVSERKRLLIILDDTQVKAVQKDLLRRIHERSGGSPVLLSRMCDVLIAEGDSVLDLNQSDGLLKLRPHIDYDAYLHVSTDAAIASLFDQLNNDFRNVLKASSVFGQYFNLADLAALLKSELGELQSLIKSMDTFNFIGQGHDPLQFFFRHITIQSYGLKEDLHLQIASIYEQKLQSGDESVLPMLCYHLGKAGETEKRMEYLEILGELCMQRYSILECEKYFSLLISLAKTKEVPNLKRAGWLLRLAQSQVYLRNSLPAKATMIEAFQLLDFKWPATEAEAKEVLKAAAMKEHYTQTLSFGVRFPRLLRLWVRFDAKKEQLLVDLFMNLRESMVRSAVALSRRVAETSFQNEDIAVGCFLSALNVLGSFLSGLSDFDGDAAVAKIDTLIKIPTFYVTLRNFFLQHFVSKGMYQVAIEVLAKGIDALETLTPNQYYTWQESWLIWIYLWAVKVKYFRAEIDKKSTHEFMTLLVSAELKGLRKWIEDGEDIQ
ncbi:hypothetical protein HDU96_005379 [Phlyctochytrium bullatum]|nr:hypothetical protein HDU96_005379 [Phlyctochytrium bullatum]